VAFTRIAAIAPGKSVTVTLVVRPDSHAVVLDDGPSVYDADVVVERGRLQLSVGGGQPTSPGGGGGGTLNATVVVTNSSLVNSC
jgi:hypothetical protein